MSQQSGWQLSGNAPVAYERYIIPAFMGEWAQDLVATAGLRAGERVLDVACGTGVVARYAVPAVGSTGQVVGVDVNESMLAMARTVSPPSGASLEWRQSDALALPFPDATFEVVLCQQGLQYFPERATALREMARVLVPGGRLVLSVWRAARYQHGFFAVIPEVLERYVGAEVASPLRMAFSLGEAEELRALLLGAGFRAPQVRLVIKQMRYAPLEEYLSGWVAASPMAGAVAALDEATRTAMFHEFQTALRPYVDDDGLASPMECNVALAQR